MRTILGALALVAALAAPAAAQDPMAMMMEMHPGAHAALMHRQELGLTADQVARLTAIDSAFARTMRQHCEQVRAAGGPTPQTHAAMHPQMMAAMDASLRETNAVLTADQRARLDSLHAAHHAQMAGHGMAGMRHDSASMAAMHHDSASMAAMHHDSASMAAMHHDSASMAAMHAQMHGSGAAPTQCDCCAHMGAAHPTRP